LVLWYFLSSFSQQPSSFLWDLKPFSGLIVLQDQRQHWSTNYIKQVTKLITNFVLMPVHVRSKIQIQVFITELVILLEAILQAMDL
jgi:hypothetical protein